MGFFDALTGNAGHEAANNQRGLYNSIIPNLALTGQTGYQQAGDALQRGFGGARDWLSQGYGASGNAINQGADSALGYLDQGQRGAQGWLGQARNDLTANGGAYAPLSALAERFGQGSKLYSDALGINGAEGNQRARSAFEPSQSYTFNLDQGIDAINRRRNAAGSLNGGNADRDAQVFGAGLASQESGKWLDRLSGFNPLELAATQGAAAGTQANNQLLAGLDLTGANLTNSGGRDRAGIATGRGNSLADLAGRYYGGQAGLSTGEGAAMANNYIGGAQNWQGIFQNAIPGYNDTFKQDAKASNDASANGINLSMNLAKLLTGASGGFNPSSWFNSGSAAVSDPTFSGFSRPGTNAWSARA